MAHRRVTRLPGCLTIFVMSSDTTRGGLPAVNRNKNKYKLRWQGRNFPIILILSINVCLFYYARDVLERGTLILGNDIQQTNIPTKKVRENQFL